MTIEEAGKLKVGDKIDHRDNVGKFVLATIIAKNGTKLRIHYDGWGQKWDTWQDYTTQLHNFAKAKSISQRPPHRFKDIAVHDWIECNSKRDPGWRISEIRRIPDNFNTNGQIQVC